MNNIAYLLALHSIDGLGPIRLKNILDYFKDPKLAWEANSGELLKLGIPKPTIDLLVETRKRLTPQTYVESIKNSGISYVTFFDENYPQLLKQIYDPPTVLYFKGKLGDEEKTLAVVGTRKITGYGRVVTEEFVKGLVVGGLTIVSGLAKGVDSQAHLSTVKAKGRTVAVLGGGLNYIYPPENKSLAEQIVQSDGLILSEFPPDYPSLPGNFPSRNRIISGLSLGVLVIEAAEDSGSLITARLALEQGREVFAVPGPIPWARVVMNAEEILDELGINQVQSMSGKVQSDNLTQDEKQILDILENEQLHIDEICRKLNLSAAKVSGTLLKMEIQGFVQNLGSGMYCRV